MDDDDRFFRDCEREPTYRLRTPTRRIPLDGRGTVKQRFEPDTERCAMTEAALETLRKAGLL